MTEKQITEIRQVCEEWLHCEPQPNRISHEEALALIYTLEAASARADSAEHQMRHLNRELDKMSNKENKDYLDQYAALLSNLDTMIAIKDTALDARDKAIAERDEYETRWRETDTAHSKTFIALCDMKKRAEFAEDKLAKYESDTVAFRELFDHMDAEGIFQCPKCAAYERALINSSIICGFCVDWNDGKGFCQDCDHWSITHGASKFRFDFDRFSDTEETCQN